MFTYDQLGAGARLHSERQKLGFTTEGFSQRIGIDFLTYINYEAGLDCPSVEQFLDMYEANINVGYVVFGVDRNDSFDLNYKLVLDECNVLANYLSQLHEIDLTPSARIMTVLIGYERVMGVAPIWQNSSIASKAGFPSKQQS